MRSSLKKSLASICLAGLLKCLPLTSEAQSTNIVYGPIVKDTILIPAEITQYLATPSVSGNGSLNYEKSQDDWYDSETNLEIEAIPSDYHSFSYWSGQTNSSERTLNLPINQAWTNLVANFSPKKTSRGLEYSLLAQYGLINPQTPDNEVEAIQELDSDNDFYKNWEEVVWGTNPTNQNSFPRIEFDVISNDIARVTIPESVDRSLYSVYGRQNLSSGNWQLETNSVGVNGELNFDFNKGTNKTYFYKAGARLRE